MAQRLKLLTRSLLILLVVFALPLATSGCAALSAAVPVLSQVANVASNALSVIDAVESASDAFFTVKPDAAKQAAVDRAISDCRLAIAAATATAQGAKDLDQKQADAAFQQFRDAYTRLTALVDDIGLAHNGRFASGAPLPVPLAARHLQ